jgi:hypothetical protein
MPQPPYLLLSRSDVTIIESNRNRDFRRRHANDFLKVYNERIMFEVPLLLTYYAAFILLQ